jgi:hypothetical protein
MNGLPIKRAQMPLHSQNSNIPSSNLTYGIEAMRLINIIKDSTSRYPDFININTPAEQDRLAKEISEWRLIYKKIRFHFGIFSST